MNDIARLKDYRNKMEVMFPGNKIVATNGCFDVLHIGHIQMLTAAARFGFLVVGVNSDSSVRALKGPTRPINNQEDRVAVLMALRVVHNAGVFDGERAVEFLDAVRPHVYVKAGDYSLETLDKDELTILRKHNSEIIFTPYLNGISTSGILKKI